MKSSNPVFSRRVFNRNEQNLHADDAAVGLDPYAQGTADQSGTVHDVDAVSGPQPAVQQQVGGAAMTIDDVVARTAMTLGTVVLFAVLAWVLLPVDEAGLSRSYGIAIGAGLLAFGLSLVQSFKARPVPALILAYAAFEGVFLGVISSVTSTYISPGVVIQTVLGTMAVFAGVLIAYKMRWIRVTRRFYGFVMAAAMGFVLLTVANLLFSAFAGGDGLGLRSGGLGIVFGVIGIILGACFLALDFKQVEDGIAHGAPREESWLAAFGLTLTLVWIYVEALQLFSILNGGDKSA
ncbi:membrane protein [Streptomyces albiflavescens]|uniref:Membrane protein n=1 Tax=Streptomyces albiflavescens TaxID=1623582 RepID=A0A917YFZ6_9ACTN|nr:Bax inhibitor-1/YccA family protein [Streptomyces albiflavescens]GGN95194.1 membrane protein [Streptomyces albiflavescens]